MEKALKLALVALAIRLLVAPFLGHLWDVKTLQETAFYTIKGYNVYELVYTLSRKVSEASGQPIFYEGYAYPPHLIIIILPFYILYLALGGDPQPIKVSEAIAGVSLLYELQFYLSKDVFLFLAIIKMPMILADSAIVYLLGRRSERLAAIYALSPYSIFITAAWGMFDSIVALALILSILFFERGRYVLSGIAYGLSLVKIYSLVALPVFLLHARNRGFEALKSFIAGLALSQAPTLAFLALNPEAFMYSVVVFHLFRQPSGLTPLRMLNVAENTTLTMAASTIHTLVSLAVYILILATMYRRNVDLKVGVAATLLYFQAFSKVVHEQYYLSVYPILLELRPREARVLEYIVIAYGLVSVGLFLAAPTLLFLVDFRILELHASIVYGDIGYITTSLVGPLIATLLSIVAFTVTLKTIMNLLKP